MNTRTTSLDDLIREFEGPISDKELLNIVAYLREDKDSSSLGKLKRRYLCGRVYELLGYCARHTPWLANHPKWYWHLAAEFFREADDIAANAKELPPDIKHFMRGKARLRSGLSSSTRAAGCQEILDARGLFDEAAARARDESLHNVYSYERYVADRFLREPQLVTTLSDVCRTLAWDGSDAGWEQVRGITRDLLATLLSDRGSLQTAKPGERRSNFLKISSASFKVRLHKIVIDRLMELRKKCRANPATAGKVDGEIEWHLAQWDSAIKESSSLCLQIGLEVRGAHDRAMHARAKAEVLFARCMAVFGETVKADALRSENLRKRLGGKAVRLSEFSPVLLQEGPVPDAVLHALREAGIFIDARALLRRDGSGAWTLTGRNGYCVLEAKNNDCFVTPLRHSSFDFDPLEAQTYSRYEALSHKTCEHYTQCRRAIEEALEKTRGVYEELDAMLGNENGVSDLNRLRDEVSNVRHVLKSKHYPLLQVIEDRILHCWTLLEMFEVRNGTIRRGTLTTGKCHGVMKDPFDDRIIEIGNDPLFRNGIALAFCGAKGEEDLHRLQTRVLKTVTKTLQMQRELLESELREIDPDLCHATSQAFLQRLACHESLAQAITTFTWLLAVGAPDQVQVVAAKAKSEEMNAHFRAARQALERTGEHGSPLVDMQALCAIEAFTNGVAEAAIGMTAHYKKQPWRAHYDASEVRLDECLRIMADCKEPYFFSDEELRHTWLDYVKARAATVQAWKAWNVFMESGRTEDAHSAARLFREAEKILEGLRDHRGATKAKARALEIEVRASLAEDGESFRQHERKINKLLALYNACGDDYGYERVRRLMIEPRVSLGVTVPIDIADVRRRYDVLKARDLGELERAMLNIIGFAQLDAFDMKRFLRQRVEGRAAEIRLYSYYFEEHKQDFERLVTKVARKESLAAVDERRRDEFIVDRQVAKATGIRRLTIERSQMFKLVKGIIQDPPKSWTIRHQPVFESAADKKALELMEATDPARLAMELEERSRTSDGDGSD